MKGKALSTVCMETLVSLQLSAQAPVTMFTGLEESIIEYLSIIKVVLEHYLCICVLLFTF